MNRSNSEWLPGLLGVASLLSLALVSGCPDESADMARQLSQGAPRKSGSGGSAQQAPPGKAEAPGLAGRDGQPAAAGEPGQDGRPGLPGKAGEPAPGAEEAAEAAGPKTEYKLLNVKAPYPRFTGAGYYDFDVEVTALESIPVSVWNIKVLDEAGEVVGSDQQVLVLVLNRAKSFSFRKFYCSSLPVAVELELTDKKAEAVPAEGSDKGGKEQPKPGIGKGGGQPGGSGGGAAGGGAGSGGGGAEEEEDPGAGAGDE